MFTYLILVTIALPSETSSFRVYTKDQFPQPICLRRAEALADRIAHLIRAGTPYAAVRIERSCHQIVTSKI